MITARQTAAYLFFLAADETESIFLTHLHVQKLLYYVQGWSLALSDQAVFSDPIVAWKHGPVVFDLYGELKHYGNKPIVDFDSHTAGSIDGNDRFRIAAVWEKYKGFSAISLRNKTHRESPWLKARVGIPPEVNKNVVISHESLKEFFKTQRESPEAPIGSKVDWNRPLASGKAPNPKFLEAVQSVFITDSELLKRLAQ